MGPSSAAVQKFLQRQEQKKREDSERRIQEKISTLEHRAAQGDKKAKTQLKRFKDEKTKVPDHTPPVQRSVNRNHVTVRSEGSEPSTSIKKKTHEPNFEELMRLAASNKNEIRQTEPNLVKKIRKNTPKPQSLTPEPTPSKPLVKLTRPVSIIPPTRPIVTHANRPHRSPPISKRPSLSKTHRNHYENCSTNRYEDPYEDDDYESDGFVVDDEDPGAQAELDKTIRSVFRYDKRQAKLREQALDREYRAIGRVSTFEDLEREERRASRLAAEEDARALREEEEHKRLKRLRLKRKA